MGTRGEDSRWLIAIIGALIIAFMAFMTFITTFVWWGRCGGDGGYPFSARASRMGEVCEAVYLPQGTPIAGVGIALLVIAGVAFVLAIIRRKTKLLLIAGTVGFVIHMAVIAPTFILDGDCTASQRESLPARQCQTYN